MSFTTKFFVVKDHMPYYSLTVFFLLIKYEYEFFLLSKSISIIKTVKRKKWMLNPCRPLNPPPKQAKICSVSTTSFCSFVSSPHTLFRLTSDIIADWGVFIKSISIFFSKRCLGFQQLSYSKFRQNTDI